MEDLAKVGSALSKQNGKLLARYFALPLQDPMPPSIFQSQMDKSTFTVGSMLAQCKGKIRDENLAQVYSSRIDTIYALSRCDWKGAVDAATVMYDKMVSFWANEGWSLPAFKQVTNDYRLLAELADRKCGQTGNPYLRSIETYLKETFPYVGKDRIPITDFNSKRRALFAVINPLFRVYFKLNILKNLQGILKFMETPQQMEIMAHHLDEFSPGEVVTFKYFRGRLHMFEDDFIMARDCLRFAFRHTPRSQLQNRQRILASLVPVEMNLGIMPTSVIASTYGLHELYELSVAVQRGDLRTFDRSMRIHQRTFIRLGVYLALEHTKLLCYRNLCKAVYKINNEEHLLPLALIETAMKMMYDDENEVSLDEIECIVSNLIYQGKVKGYINHEKRMLVLKKAGTPFPIDAFLILPE